MPRSPGSHQQGDFRETSLIPDSQPGSESDRDHEFDIQPPQPRSKQAKVRLKRQVKDYVQRQDCTFRQWNTDYRFTRIFTRGMQELEKPLSLRSIQPVIGDFWVHETHNPGNGAQDSTYQYWYLKPTPALFWKEVWPGIGDRAETHPHPGCQYIKLCWKEETFKKRRIILPVWRINPGTPASKLSKDYSKREPLEIKKPANPTSSQAFRENVPESPEVSDIEYLGTAEAYETKSSPSTAITPETSPSATPIPQGVGTSSPAPSNNRRLSQESLAPYVSHSALPKSPPPSRLPLSANRYSAFYRQLRTPTVDPPSRSPSIARSSMQEPLQPPTPQPVGILEWMMDILRRLF